MIYKSILDFQKNKGSNQFFLIGPSFEYIFIYYLGDISIALIFDKCCRLFKYRLIPATTTAAGAGAIVRARRTAAGARRPAASTA